MYSLASNSLGRRPQAWMLNPWPVSSRHTWFAAWYVSCSQTGRGGIAKIELRLGPSRPRASRSASRQPSSSSPSGMSIPAILAGSQPGPWSSTPARDACMRTSAKTGLPMALASAPGLAGALPGAGASRVTATQPRLQASTPVTRIGLRSHIRFPAFTSLCVLSCALSGEAASMARRAPLGFPGGRAHYRRH
jgi:hypothetical protein